MKQIVVINELPRLNPGPERRPFRVLTPPERSSALVIARYSNRPRQRALKAPVTQQQLTWRAIRVGAFWAAFAFAFFCFSQRNSFVRSGEGLGALPDSVQRLRFGSGPPASAHAPQSINLPQPLPDAVPADAKSIDGHSDPPTFALPDPTNLTVTEFNLSVTPGFQTVGHVDLRINSVNASANTYDITIRTPTREFYRQDVKLSEHIPLSKTESDGPELVVGAISQNRVFGYIAEPRHRNHRHHRRRTQ
jgi:hypothetical protein